MQDATVRGGWVKDLQSFCLEALKDFKVKITIKQACKVLITRVTLLNCYSHTETWLDGVTMAQAAPREEEDSS